MLLEPIMEYRATKQILGHPQDPILRAFFGADAFDEVYIDEHKAMNISACWAATTKLAGSLSSLPLKVYERRPDGGRREAREHVAWRILHSRANREIGAMPLRALGIARQVNLGNSYCEIERDSAGRPIGLWPINNSRVKPCRDERTKDLFYSVKNNNGPDSEIDAEDVLNIVNVLSFDGIQGRGVIDHAADSLRLARSTERHGLAFFNNGARPGIVVKHPHRMPDESRKNFRREWNEIYQGPDSAGKMAILSDGGDIVQLEISNEAAQFLETRQFSINEVARWYNVPPTMLASLERATWSNAEQMGVEFVLYSLVPLAVLWEQECNHKLFSESERERYYCEHVFDGLLRGDALARAQAFQVQVRSGAVTIDEWRAAENRNPLDGGVGSIAMASRDMAPIDAIVNGTVGVSSESDPVQRAARSALADTYGRIMRRDAKALESNVGKPNFIDAVEQQFEGRAAQFAEQLVPTLQLACASLRPGVAIDCRSMAVGIASRWAARTKAGIIKASEVRADRLAASVRPIVQRLEQTEAMDLAVETVEHLLAYASPRADQF